MSETNESARLPRILAMLDSDAQGEAEAALRLARPLLGRAGLNFADLAAAAARAQLTPLYGGSTDHGVIFLECESLRREVRELRRQLADMRREHQQAQAEADRWRAIAQDAAESLWSIGQSLHPEARDAAQEKQLNIRLDRMQSIQNSLNQTASPKAAEAVGTKAYRQQAESRTAQGPTRLPLTEA